jgi:hypothetical protein
MVRLSEHELSVARLSELQALMSSNLLLHSSGESGWKRINTAVPAGD